MNYEARIPLFFQGSTAGFFSVLNNIVFDWVIKISLHSYLIKGIMATSNL